MELDDETSLKIFGTKELSDLFNEMREDIQKKVIITAFKKIAKRLITETKSNIQSSLKNPTRLMQQVGSKEDKESDMPVLTIGVKNKKSGALAHLFNNGTAERFYTSRSNKLLFKKQKNNKHTTGKIKAKNFFENAINNTSDFQDSEINDEIRLAFERLIKRYDRQNNN